MENSKVPFMVKPLVVNAVVVNNPVFGLNVNLVLDTRASVNDPDVAVANVG